MGMVDEVGRHATVAANKNRKKGIEEILTLVPASEGVKVAPKIGKKRPKRNAGIVARRATRRVSAGSSALIRRKPDPDPSGPNKEIGEG